MKVILRADHKGLGKRGDIVEVSDGHARNFLLPKGIAFTATDGAVTQAGTMRRSRDLRDAADRESAQAVASKLVATTITIAVKSGAEVVCSARSPLPMWRPRSRRRPTSRLIGAS